LDWGAKAPLSVKKVLKNLHILKDYHKLAAYKKNLMHNLMSFKEARIEALLNELNKKNQQIQQLETYVFELCDKDCPDEYRYVVQQQVFSTKDQV
jgi:hypothetical protein